MRVTIIGGGNIGTLMAAEMASRNHTVTVYTSKPDKWQKNIDVYDADENLVLTGNIDIVTDNLQLALKEAEIVWITLPAQTFHDIAEKILPYIRTGQMIGVVPGSGGAEFAFYEFIKKGCILFGLQRVHSIARLKEYGKSVYMLGRKMELQIGAIPSTATKKVAQTVLVLLEMPCVILPNYLCVTLTPSNPILHTTRLYSMFKDYKEGSYYPRNFLFYEEWTDESSEKLLSCDEELQNLCKSIPLQLEDVKSLREHYESVTAEAMTSKIQSISAFKGLTSPMKCDGEDRWVPDFNSRYFTADFSYGLKIILDLCEIFDVKALNINEVWNWYVSVVPEAGKNCFELGLTKKEFIGLYK